MKYALFIIEKNEGEAAGTKALLELSKTVESSGLVKSGKVEILNAGAYLCRIDTCGLQALLDLYCFSQERQLRSRTLFFDQEPPWVITPSRE